LILVLLKLVQFKIGNLKIYTIEKLSMRVL